MAFTHGGARPGSGRPRKELSPREKELLAEGYSPLEMMLTLMREGWDYLEQLKDGFAQGETIKNSSGDDVPITINTVMSQADRVFGYAKDAAPFCHPRLAQIKNDSPSESQTYRITVDKDDMRL